MSEYIVHHLDSCTVLWVKDLGMPEDKLRRLSFAEGNAAKREAERISMEVDDWLKVNTKGDYRLYEKGVWFARSRDAVIFKMFWNGKFS